MALFPGTPNLESRNCPETIPVRVPGLWELITLDCKVQSQRGFHQSCSPCRDLSNDILNTPFGRWEDVDSRLLVVGSQIANLTSGPSLDHNLGCRCPNDQCEGILDIYTSRPFQWHQEHPNARFFSLYCRTLNIRESRRTLNPQLWAWEFHPPTSPKVGLRHNGWIESSLVNLHPSPSVMLHFETHCPHPKHWGPTLSTIALKLIWPNLILGIGGHCFATATRFFHWRCALARVRLATFWSFRLCTTIAFPKMWAFILAWSWCRGPPTAIEGLPGLAFSATKPCTSFKCLVNNHLAQYAIVQVPTLHLHFDPTCVHSLSFRAKLGGQRSASGLGAWSDSTSGPKPKNERSKTKMQVLQNINSLNHILFL